MRPRKLLIDEMITISVTISLEASEVSGGEVTPFGGLLTNDFALEGQEAAIASLYLDSLARAIDERRVFGFMEQEMIETRVSMGEIRPETEEEAIQRDLMNYRRDDATPESSEDTPS